MKSTLTETIKNFYLQTSMYTYLGPYSEFAKNLPDDIKTLCLLQLTQTIHPAVYVNSIDIKKDKNSFYGDMTKIPCDRLNNEEDIFPTALAILAELLRRDPNYWINREAKNKINILCRGNALLLASILKAKKVPTRVRTGFAKYHYTNGTCDDQWNIEYFNFDENRWVMVDPIGIGKDTNSIDEMVDVSSDKFITASEAWLHLRKIKPCEKFDSNTRIINLGGYYDLEATWFGVVNDFNALMNNEIPVTMEPIYLYQKQSNGRWDLRGFTNKELEELDVLAGLMLNPDENFEKLQYIYNKEPKFKKLLGISTWN